MYRAVAKLALEKGVSAEEVSSIVSLAQSAQIELKITENECKTVINNSDWTNCLDRYEIVKMASEIAALPEVREILTQKQRTYASKRAMIMEGRDIGSVVFPGARWKFFITASVDVRSRRMLKMMSEEERRLNQDFSILVKRIEELDRKDKNREIAPLRVADDAIVYDNSDSPTAEQDALILHYYMTHADEIAKNAQVLLTYKNQEILLGKHH